MQGIENDEDPRPEFETSVKTFRINPVTREKEVFIPKKYIFLLIDLFLCLPFYFSPT